MNDIEEQILNYCKDQKDCSNLVHIDFIYKYCQLKFNLSEEEVQTALNNLSSSDNECKIIYPSPKANKVSSQLNKISKEDSKDYSFVLVVCNINNS